MNLKIQLYIQKGEFALLFSGVFEEEKHNVNFQLLETEGPLFTVVHMENNTIITK